MSFNELNFCFSFWRRLQQREPATWCCPGQRGGRRRLLRSASAGWRLQGVICVQQTPAQATPTCQENEYFRNSQVTKSSCMTILRLLSLIFWWWSLNLTNDVTAIGHVGQGFYDDSIQVLLLKKNTEITQMLPKLKQFYYFLFVSWRCF